jgi:hypothetical protein
MNDSSGDVLEACRSLPGAMPCDIVAALPTAAARHSHRPSTDAGSSSSSTARPRVRLLQILSPSLIGRANIWGSTLSVKPSWECTDAPYFDAPGQCY